MLFPEFGITSAFLIEANSCFILTSSMFQMDVCCHGYLRARFGCYRIKVTSSYLWRTEYWNYSDIGCVITTLSIKYSF